MSEDLRVTKTRTAIRNALLELMSEKELTKITISEICARAQINRKTFYCHYRSPDTVIEELENEVLDDFSQILRRGGDSIIDIDAAIRDISMTIEHRHEFFKQFMRQNPDIFNKGKIKAMLCRVIIVSMKSAGAPTDNEAILNAAAEYTISGVLALHSAWFDRNCKESLAFITDTATRLVKKGLSAYVSEDQLTKPVSKSKSSNR